MAQTQDEQKENFSLEVFSDGTTSPTLFSNSIVYCRELEISNNPAVILLQIYGYHDWNKRFLSTIFKTIVPAFAAAIFSQRLLIDALLLNLELTLHHCRADATK